MTTDLEYLAARPGRLASTRELLDALWPHAWVTDGVLEVCVREIRRALDDDARSPRYIETAHRRGHRFIAPVERAHRVGIGLRSASPTDEPKTRPPVATHRRRPTSSSG
jgi:DNA-binding winged helix-turn-helix (wHTH) protein